MKRLLAVVLLLCVGLALPAFAVGPQVTLPNGGIATVMIPIDAIGNVQAGCGNTSAFNIAASTVVSVGVKRVCAIVVITAGTTAGTVNDTTTTGSAAIGNQFYTVPNTVGFYPMSWLTANGIVVVPGTGQVIAVQYQ